jgi:signal transduction histidine kinase
MTTLRSYSEMLVDGRITDPARRQHYLETLHREAVRLAHLVNNVLAYSGLERGRPAASLEPLPVGPLLERMRERLGARAADSGMALELDAPEGLVLRGDAGPIEQILFNLVDNAAKYGAGRVSISAVAHGAKIELRVRDEGRGVSAEVRGRLFEPFSRSAEKAAGGVPGVGLGLALSRALARAMGGDLRLEPGAPGACFLLTLAQA